MTFNDHRSNTPDGHRYLMEALQLDEDRTRADADADNTQENLNFPNQENLNFAKFQTFSKSQSFLYTPCADDRNRSVCYPNGRKTNYAVS